MNLAKKYKQLFEGKTRSNDSRLLKEGKAENAAQDPYGFIIWVQETYQYRYQRSGDDALGYVQTKRSRGAGAPGSGAIASKGIYKFDDVVEKSFKEVIAKKVKQFEILTNEYPTHRDAQQLMDKYDYSFRSHYGSKVSTKVGAIEKSMTKYDQKVYSQLIELKYTNPDGSPGKSHVKIECIIDRSTGKAAPITSIVTDRKGKILQNFKSQ